MAGSEDPSVPILQNLGDEAAAWHLQDTFCPWGKQGDTAGQGLMTSSVAQPWGQASTSMS
uniref:Uncharacterized protein n=1 Tax=Malurus cyaneus samueli TaxID=2593467 RepID=A0A8C5TB32_9PASS